MYKALNILGSQNGPVNIKERNKNFIAHIENHMPILTKKMDPGFKKFLKKLGVAAARILDFLTGGALSYKNLFTSEANNIHKELYLTKTTTMTDEFLTNIKLQQIALKHDLQQSRISGVQPPNADNSDEVIQPPSPNP